MLTQSAVTVVAHNDGGWSAIANSDKTWSTTRNPREQFPTAIIPTATIIRAENNDKLVDKNFRSTPCNAAVATEHVLSITLREHTLVPL